MININDYIVDLLETCRFGLDGGAMFGVVPKTLWERAYAAADEKNRIPMAAKALLLRGHGKTILVDTGNSPFMSEKELQIYGIDFRQFTLEGSLNALGVTADDITDVLLTHLHFDHVGGAVIVDGNDLIPRFKNATYHVQKEHLTWARSPSIKDKASFIPSMFEPLAACGVLETLDGDGEVFPGVSVRPLHGHSPFMQGVLVQDSETRLFYPADLMPTGAHVSLPYGMAYDNQPLVTIAEKTAVYDQMIDEEWIVVFEHDALRQAARVIRTDRGAKLDDDFVITPDA